MSKGDGEHPDPEQLTPLEELPPTDAGPGPLGVEGEITEIPTLAAVPTPPAEAATGGEDVIAAIADEEAGLPPVEEGPPADEEVAEEEGEEEEIEREPSRLSRLLASIGEASPYTMLLGVAVLALAVAIALLLAEASRYDFDSKVFKSPWFLAMLGLAGLVALAGPLVIYLTGRRT
jgi:hypothetical protein